MIYREVQYLANSLDFQNFIRKYNLKLEVINNEKILLISECLIFEIYGLLVEDFFYFDLYSIDLKYQSTINRLLSVKDPNKLQSIYLLQISKRSEVLIPQLQVSQLQSNLQFTLKAEQYFFSIIQIMDDFLSEILFCKKKIEIEHWSDTFETKKQQLQVIVDSVFGR